MRGLPDTAGTLRGVRTLLKVRFGTHPSVGAVLEARAAEQPDAPALLFEDQRWSYAQFNAWVNRLAHALRGAGVKPGDIVALLMENHANTLACVAALAKLGAIPHAEQNCRRCARNRVRARKATRIAVGRRGRRGLRRTRVRVTDTAPCGVAARRAPARLERSGGTREKAAAGNRLRPARSTSSPASKS